MNDLHTQDDNATVSRPSITDSAVLAKLKRKGMRLQRKMDESVQKEVRMVVGDDSATVSSHLFTESGSPVRELIRMDGRAYQWHKKETLAWADAGPRLLVGPKIQDYVREAKNLSDAQDKFLKEEVLIQWDQLVQRDMQFRAKAAMSEPNPVKRDAKLARISADEYPTAEEMEGKFSLTFRILFVNADDPRAKLSDDVVKTCLENAELEKQDAMVQARKDIAARMVVPLVNAVNKLKVPVDEKGAVFRDSLVNNLYEALEEVKNFDFSDDPDLVEAIAKANDFLYGVMGGTESLRTMPEARDKAANSLEELSRVFTNLK